jgi:hypothetical protein
MHDETFAQIGRTLSRFQSSLRERGSTLDAFLRANYLNRWESDTLLHVMAIRTSLLAGMQDYLIGLGLMNLERVQLSLLTDPLAHEVEHTPSILYKGQPYLTTHSMIYSKLLACSHPRIPGVFVDSPNIRLEMASVDGSQRGKYLVDFSQLDVEVRRNRGIGLEAYLHEPEAVEEILREDLAGALQFFEGMFRAGLERVLSRNEADLAALGVALDPPPGPFPAFRLDDGLQRHPREDVEAGLGRETESPFFFVTGLLRENYDLVYPYLQRDGTRPPLSSLPSRLIYNYDLCVKSTLRSNGQASPAKEVLSGGLREWLPEPMVARLLDQGVLPEPPVFRDGAIQNIEELGGYGPFLMVAHGRDTMGRSTFPDTFGGGLGIERALWGILRGPLIHTIEEVTCFGKNPDSQSLYLF